jgi:hypothetical protein
MQRYCADFLMYDWLILCCIEDEISYCSVEYCWWLDTEQQ